MFGSGLGWFTPPKLTQTVGADIVMESIAPVCAFVSPIQAPRPSMRDFVDRERADVPYNDADFA
jgi:hypothetical protein